MKKLNLHIILSFALIVFWSACSPVKHLEEGQVLYTGGEITFDPDTGTASEYEEPLSELLRPQPNTSFLWMYPKLYFYNISKEPTGKGLNYLLHKKWGEKPVLDSSLDLSINEKLLNNYLYNIGFFNSTVSGDTRIKNQKEEAEYTIDAGHRYTIRKVYFPKDSSLEISSEIRELERSSLLDSGDYYDLTTIKGERNRINDSLKNKGYYYFSPQDLILLVDSSLNRKVDLYMRIKKGVAQAALQKYHIEEVNVYPNYSIRNAKISDTMTPLYYKGLNIYDGKELYRPSIFHRSIYLHPGNLYTLADHNLTLNRLVNLGTFKYVKVDFNRIDTAADNYALAANVYLTPAKRKSLRFEINGNSRSNNFVGSSVDISWQNKNIFRGAELLKINLGGSFETQVGGDQAAANTYSFSPGISLEVPRFVTPFQIINMARVKIPKTVFSINYELMHRENYYNMNSFNFLAGYRWRQNNRISHTLNVFDVSYVLPSHMTPLFKSILEKDPTLQRSFREQFLLGTNYSFEYSERGMTERRNNMYFLGKIDLSGNLFGLFSGKHNHNNPAKLFGTPFSQYVKVSGDFRDYWRLNSSGLEWANRIFVGYGYSYGNSYSLPYVKQFYNGGSNSLRGFRSRTLGPGSYHTSETGFHANEAGDIKFEINSELRFPIVSILKGALFVDAGNIWLLRSDSTRSGAQFQLNRAFSQLAVDAGLGFRFDLSFFVLRFDVAFPLRKPWLPKGDRWTFDTIDFGDKSWRKENMILNIAIGYPF